MASARSSGAWRASAQRIGPAWGSAARRIDARSDPETRSDRDRSTTPARRSACTGSRNRPRGNRFPRPNGSSRVDEDDIEVARQAAMLEPVVQHEQLRFKLLDGHPGQPGAIAVLKVGDVGQVLLQHPAFVIQPGMLTVAPAQDGHPDAARAVPARDVFDRGRLAGPAERRGFRPRPRVPRPPGSSAVAAVEGLGADRHAQTITERRHAQGEPGCRRQWAAALAPDQSQIARRLRPLRPTPLASTRLSRRGPAAFKAPMGVDNRLGHLQRPDRTRVVAAGLHVVGDRLAFLDHLGDRRIEPSSAASASPRWSSMRTAERIRAVRIHFVLPLVLRRRSVSRLEDRPGFADIRSRRDTEPADKARRPGRRGYRRTGWAAQGRRRSRALCTSCMHMLSTIRSSNSISVYSLATSRLNSRKRPSEYLRMFALWTLVTFLRPCRLAQGSRSAYLTMRLEPVTEDRLDQRCPSRGGSSCR